MSLTHRFVHVAGLALLVAVAACGDKNDSMSEESALARDLTLAEQAQQPISLSDAPKENAPPVQAPTTTKAPVSRRPAPAQTASRPAEQTPPQKQAPVPTPNEPAVTPLKAATPGPTTGTIPAGTVMTASLGSRVCTSAKPGEKLIGHLTETVNGSNGVSIPAGATVVLEVVSTRAITDSSKGDIDFRIRSIEADGKSYAVVATGDPASELQRTRTTTGKEDAKKVAGGAIAGAILGQIIGKDTKGTVIGAAAGAAAGGAVAAATGKYEGCLNQNGNVRVTLTDAIVIPIS